MLCSQQQRYTYPSVEYRVEAGAFTVEQLWACVADYEAKARPTSVWLGGVDHQHVFWEGVAASEEGLELCWGS